MAAAIGGALALLGKPLGNFLVVGSAPRLGLGLAALGRPGYINLGRAADFADAEGRSPEALRARAWEVLDIAWAEGVRYFDCARSYGRSEEFLSGWLAARGHHKEDVAVGSKWGYRYTADWQVDTGGAPHEVKDHSLAHLQHQQAETDALLGTHLRLYQIHSATLESGVLDNFDVLGRLQKLREESGWKIGLSLSGVQQSDTLRRALETGVFDAVQATWNPLEQSAGEALTEARQRGLEVIVKEGMANGRLLRHPALVAAAKDLGVEADALALAAAMVQPFEPMVLSGAVTPAQVRSNVGAVVLASRLQADARPLLEALLVDLRMEPAAYWSDRSELAWS